MPEEVVVRKIDIQTEEAVESMQALDESTEKVAESNQKLESGLEALPGPLGKVQQGLKGLQKGFKALLANPIVLLIAAIVAALAAMFKAFTKTTEGADKMKNVMSAVSATIDVLTERAAKLFKALGQIVRGNFKEGFQQMGDAVKGVGDEIKEATRAAIEYEKQVRKVYQSETDLITVNAERRKQIAELRFISRDLTKTYEERITALEKAAAIELEGLNESVELQKAKVELIKTEIANTPETLRTREQARTLAEAEVALTDLQTQSLERQKGLLEEVNAIRTQREAAAKAAEAEEKAKQAEADKAAADRRKAESDARKEAAELDRMFEEDMAAEKLAFEIEQAAKQKAIQDEVTANFMANAEKEIAAAVFAEQEKLAAKQLGVQAGNAILGDGFAALSSFLAEGTKLQKGIQIADGTRAAIMGAIQAYQATAGIPIVGPVLAPIAAAAALTAGMGSVRKMAQVGDPVSGGGSVPSVSLPRPAAGINAMNLVNADQSIPTEVQIRQDSAQRGPTKAYVVGSDVTAEQDIERQRQREASL
jgi:hypothetical protein